MFADVTLARRIERAEAAMAAAMVERVCRRPGAESCVLAVGAGYAIRAGPGSPFNKLTGRLGSGWSVALLDALTGREYAQVANGAERSTPETEPLTSYIAARAGTSG